LARAREHRQASIDMFELTMEDFVP
jgi:hypothetical protein